MNKKMLVWIALCLIWGSTWLFIKIGVSVIPPITFAGIRFLIATIVLTAVVFLRKLSLPNTREDWMLLLTTGILSFTMNYGLLFWGEARTTSGLAAILQTIIPVFGLLLAHYYLPSEQMTWAKVSGVLLGIAGVVIIFVTQLHGESAAAFAGSVAIVGGSFLCGMVQRYHQSARNPHAPGGARGGTNGLWLCAAPYRRLGHRRKSVCIPLDGRGRSRAILSCARGFLLRISSLLLAPSPRRSDEDDAHFIGNSGHRGAAWSLVAA